MKKTGTGKISRNRLLTGLGRALSFSALLLLACGLPPPALRAEVPVKFNYQGNLRQAGFLVNGNRSMVFRLYASSTSAVELWASPAYNVSLSTGVFRVALEPAIADWQSGSLWLELEVEGNRMSPREELTSSPYSINSLMLSGKRYTTAATAPAAPAAGDLWYDSALNAVSYWNGAAWTPTAGSGLPAAHASLHGAGGTDPIVSLGTHTVTGYITVSSAVTAGWLSGDGSGIYSLSASNINSGFLNGDRIGNVIVSTHIVDGSIQTQDLADGSVTKAKLNQSGCANGDMLQLVGGAWACGSPAGPEADPLSIHSQETLQAGTTFYVSSGTVNALNVQNSLKVTGTAQIMGAPGQAGLSVEATGNVGIGTENPAAKLDVTGPENPGQYIAVFNSGNKLAAWLRNK